MARSATASEGSSSDELNNKRCKYDNFSQDVASNNKIKIIPKVSKVTGQNQTGRGSGSAESQSPGVAQDSP